MSAAQPATAALPQPSSLALPGELYDQRVELDAGECEALATLRAGSGRSRS